jgi:hypothetical protein
MLGGAFYVSIRETLPVSVPGSTWMPF